MQGEYNKIKQHLGLDEALADSSEDEQDPYIARKNAQRTMLGNTSKYSKRGSRLSQRVRTALVPIIQPQFKQTLVDREFTGLSNIQTSSHLGKATLKNFPEDVSSGLAPAQIP